MVLTLRVQGVHGAPIYLTDTLGGYIVIIVIWYYVQCVVITSREITLTYEHILSRDNSSMITINEVVTYIQFRLVWAAVIGFSFLDRLMLVWYFFP